VGRWELKSNRQLTDIHTEPSPALLFFFSQPPVAHSFVSSWLIIHLLIARRSRLRRFIRYLEPCLSCHDGAAEGGRFPVTFHAAVRLLSSKDSALLRTKALSPARDFVSCGFAVAALKATHSRAIPPVGVTDLQP